MPGNVLQTPPTPAAPGGGLSGLMALLGLGGPTPQTGLTPSTSPVPAPGMAAPPPQTTVPGALSLPKPAPSPFAALGAMLGPSMSPSQEGAAWAPSQGPGEAVTTPDVPAQKPSILDALGAMTGGGGGGQMSAPPAPSTRGIAPGALPALLGGRNPLAAAQSPVFALLSKLLGGH